LFIAKETSLFKLIISYNYFYVYKESQFLFQDRNVTFLFWDTSIANYKKHLAINFIKKSLKTTDSKKIEKLSSHLVTTMPSLSAKIQPVQKKAEEIQPLTVQMEIEKEVADYLAPYLSGKITKENEPKDKLPLMLIKDWNAACGYWLIANG
jgi:hypothetical protein